MEKEKFDNMVALQETLDLANKALNVLMSKNNLGKAYLGAFFTLYTLEKEIMKTNPEGYKQLKIMAEILKTQTETTVKYDEMEYPPQ